MAANEKPGTSKQRILLVDDEPELLTVNMRLLTGLGYEVSMADSGEAALRILDDLPHDLVILDMVMPGLDGEATLRRIRERIADQKVMILSAFAEPEKVQAVKTLGILAYVRKPFDLGSMASTIRAVLGGPGDSGN